jgi:hypothetical protein
MGVLLDWGCCDPCGVVVEKGKIQPHQDVAVLVLKSLSDVIVPGRILRWNHESVVFKWLWPAVPFHTCAVEVEQRRGEEKETGTKRR